MPTPRSGSLQRLRASDFKGSLAAVPENDGGPGGASPRGPPFHGRSDYAAGLTGTAQPPLPLQEFLPAQPASPLLQPPWPLHEFMPLQECFMSAEAQPPLPLQEFLPAQPASPLLQPPLPLHAFWPLQTCLSDAAPALSFAFSSEEAGFFSSLRDTLAWCAPIRPEPAMTPATARPSAFTFRSPFFIQRLLSLPPFGRLPTESTKPPWPRRVTRQPGSFPGPVEF